MNNINRHNFNRWLYSIFALLYSIVMGFYQASFYVFIVQMFWFAIFPFIIMTFGYVIDYIYNKINFIIKQRHDS